MTTETLPVPLDILRNGRPESLIETFGSTRMAKVLPRITCADGFSLSVQAGAYLYSTPRDDHGPWSHVEVGYPSEKPRPWTQWSKYAETPSDPTGTVYGYVPLSLVEKLIESHSGPA